MPVLISTGHNVLFAALSAFHQEPTSSIVVPVLRDYGAGPSLHEQGLHLPLYWEFLESEGHYQDILQQCGLHNADVFDVTVWARSTRLVWTRYNGVAFYPEVKQDMDWKNYFLRDITIYICDLQALTEF